MKYPLILFTILNVFLFSMVGLAFFQGWTVDLVNSDIYHLCKIITIVFLIGLFLCGQKLFKLTGEKHLFDNQTISGFNTHYLLNLNKPGLDKNLMATTFANEISSYISIVDKFVGHLVLLGLLGTVFGVMIAFLGFDLTSIGDLSNLASASVTLVHGVKIALYTTLLGSIYSLWLSLCSHILERFSATYVYNVITFGEIHE